MKLLRQRLGDNLREARRQAGFTQEELSSRAGLHLTAVSQHERGVREPRFSTIAKLAAALRVEPNALFEGVEWLPESERFEVEVKD